MQISLDKIDVMHFYIPNKEEMEKLCTSIKKEGLRNAILVQEAKSSQGIRYRLVDGHRRLLACQMLKMDTIDCIIKGDQR